MPGRLGVILGDDDLSEVQRPRRVGSLLATLERPTGEGGIVEAMELCERGAGEAAAFELVEDGVASRLTDTRAAATVNFVDL